MDAFFRVDPMDRFAMICDEILNHLYENNLGEEVCDAEIIAAAKEDLKIMFEECSFDMETMLDTFKSKEWDQEKVRHFLALLNPRKNELLYETLLNYNCNFGETVINFDWVLKVVLGTSDLKTLKYPVLQLILYTVNADGEKKQTLYEVNKEMVEKIINALENVVEI